MENVEIVNLENIGDNLVRKENIYLLGCSVILGWLFDLLFYGKPLGVSYPLFVIAIYGALLWNMRNGLRVRFDFTWLLGVPVIALSFTYLIFSNMVFAALNFIAVPVLLVAHTILLTSNNRFKWHEPKFIFDIIYGMIARPMINFLTPFLFIMKMFRRKTQPGRFAVAGKIFAGLLVSIPILLVVISLLVSADEVFSHFIGQIPNIFKDIRIDEYVIRLIFVTVVSCAAFSYLWSLFNSNKIESSAENRSQKTKGFIDAITILTILVLMDILYIIFLTIQFSYLFGGLRYGLPESLTYSQYARRGFFELVAVTVINLFILLGCINFIKWAGTIVDKTVKVLNCILIGCTFVMLFSAHFRMSLYEEAYGYTYLRVLTHAFMGYLFVLFAITLYKIWKDKIALLKSYIAVSIIAYTLINYVNIDVIIVKNNIQRYEREHKIDAYYLTTLSYDVVPEVVEFMNNNPDTGLRSQIEDGLTNKKNMLLRKNGWQSFNISEYRAKKILLK